MRRIHTLRKHGATVPILILSVDPSIANAILTSGANWFLPKPFPVSAFTQLLRTLLPIAPQWPAPVLRFARRNYQELTNKPRVLYYTEAVAYMLRL